MGPFCFMSALMIRVAASFESGFSLDSENLLVLCFEDRSRILMVDDLLMESYFDLFCCYDVRNSKEFIGLVLFLGFH